MVNLLPFLLLGVPAAMAVPVDSNSTITSSAAVLNATATAPAEPAGPLATSPYVGPTPQARGAGPWAEAVGKAKAFIADWTIEQKVNITVGIGYKVDRCVGNIGAQPEVGFGGLCLQDGPMGVREADFVSAFTAGINAAATFDRDLIRARGLAMGQEYRGKGVHIALGPMTNMARLPEAGRNWEGFGEDPYLSGEATYETIKGMQTPGQGVQACVKHHIGNEQERDRFTSSSNIDDRTMHEIYMHPFLRSVQADVASVMCSYNLINNTWSCENPKVQNDLLKHELGFEGNVMTDWGALHSLAPAMNGGLDMSMPSGIAVKNGSTFVGEFAIAVRNGTIPEERLDDMAVRILAGYFLLGQDQPDYPAVNFDGRDIKNPSTNAHLDVQDDHAEGIRKMGAASTILLKNKNGALPLSGGLRTIALIGDDAGPSTRGPNAQNPFGSFGGTQTRGSNGILAQGGGSGSATFPYLISPLDAIQAKARENRTTVTWFLDNSDLVGANTTAQGQDAALVFVNAWSTEGSDRSNITIDLNGDALVKAVADVNENTIVIIHSVGPVDLESWIDHENVTAVIWAGLPGQEAGNALVDVLYGAYNPSGRLPYTIAKKLSDNPAQIILTDPEAEDHPQVPYSEGLLVGYKHFLANNIEPRFGFGFGLSYTDFGYKNLEVTEQKMSKTDFNDEQQYNGDTGFAGEVGASVAPWLHATRYTVEVDVTNTGSVYGCDVPQLYLKFPDGAGEPPAVLRGFERVSLSPGETKRVSFPLSQYSLSIWDVVAQKWTRPEGEFGVLIGKNAFEVVLEGKL